MISSEEALRSLGLIVPLPVYSRGLHWLLVTGCGNQGKSVQTRPRFSPWNGAVWLHLGRMDSTGQVPSSVSASALLIADTLGLAVLLCKSGFEEQSHQFVHFASPCSVNRSSIFHDLIHRLLPGLSEPAWTGLHSPLSCPPHFLSMWCSAPALGEFLEHTV